MTKDKALDLRYLSPEELARRAAEKAERNKIRLRRFQLFMAYLPVVALGAPSGWAVGAVGANVYPLPIAIVAGLMFELVYLGLIFMNHIKNRTYYFTITLAVICAITYNTLYAAYLAHIIPEHDTQVAWVIALIHGIPIPLLNVLYAYLTHNDAKANRDGDKAPEPAPVLNVVKLKKGMAPLPSTEEITEALRGEFTGQLGDLTSQFRDWVSSVTEWQSGLKKEMLAQVEETVARILEERAAFLENQAPAQVVMSPVIEQALPAPVIPEEMIEATITELMILGNRLRNGRGENGLKMGDFNSKVAELIRDLAKTPEV